MEEELRIVKAQVERLTDLCLNLSNALANESKDVSKYIKALQFYAEKDNYIMRPAPCPDMKSGDVVACAVLHYDRMILRDSGEIARKTLGLE